MKRLLIFVTFLAFAGCSQTEQPMKMIKPVDFSQVTINDSFWKPRLERHKAVTLPVCIDQIENQTGRIRNFENAAKGEGEHSGIYYDDSDVYKALEGIAYSLMLFPDPVLEAKADEWIDKFAAAQQEDGYLNTFYILTGLDGRWTNMSKHEMYCAGHMIEAAVAYFKATGKRKLLDVSIRMADHMMTIFGPDKRHWVPGHEEIELALVKLFETTGNRQYLDFSNWLLEERGHGYGTKGEGNGEWNAPYLQDDKPVREMTDIAGHAVRSMYLYCGMSDVAAYLHDTTYIATMNTIWDDVFYRNMYITGGIGSSRHNEGFTEDYDLPNKEAYCETCASIGMVYWNTRMNSFTGDSKYIDVLERSMYNGALAGINLKGDLFFYVNPLESDGDHHRKAWYGCACCPSQLSRFIPSIGNYIYGESSDAIWVHLFIGNTAKVTGATISQSTNYPWDGKVEITLSDVTSPKSQIRVRIPDWCENYSISLNGAAIQPTIEKGYALLESKWNNGDVITLKMDMPVKMVAADQRVKADEGRRAIQRGPLVYCMEEIDNPDSYTNAAIEEDASFDVNFKPELLEGVNLITTTDGKYTFIPYYAWDNRTSGGMRVWVPMLPSKD